MDSYIIRVTDFDSARAFEDFYAVLPRQMEEQGIDGKIFDKSDNFFRLTVFAKEVNYEGPRSGGF